MFDMVNTCVSYLCPAFVGFHNEHEYTATPRLSNYRILLIKLCISDISYYFSAFKDLPASCS